MIPFKELEFDGWGNELCNPTCFNRPTLTLPPCSQAPACCWAPASQSPQGLWIYRIHSLRLALSCTWKHSHTLSITSLPPTAPGGSQLRESWETRKQGAVPLRSTGAGGGKKAVFL